jgi:hypothetical protein
MKAWLSNPFHGQLHCVLKEATAWNVRDATTIEQTVQQILETEMEEALQGSRGERSENRLGQVGTDLGPRFDAEGALGDRQECGRSRRNR